MYPQKRKNHFTYVREVGMVKSAERTIRILETVARSDSGLTHTDLCQSLHIPSGSLTPLLNTITHLGYLSVDPVKKRYFLGARVLFLSRKYQEELDIVRIGEPFLAQLVGLTGESAAITIETGDRSTVVAKVNSPLSLRPSLNLGDSAPLYAGASGKIYLAFRSDEEITHYLATVPLQPFTPMTPVHPDHIWQEIRAIRAGSLSFSRECLFEGVSAVAAPIRDSQGKVVATLIINAPTFRMGADKEKNVEKALREASAAFSAMLGFGPDDCNGPPASRGGFEQEPEEALVRHR